MNGNNWFSRFWNSRISLVPNKRGAIGYIHPNLHDTPEPVPLKCEECPNKIKCAMRNFKVPEKQPFMRKITTPEECFEYNDHFVSTHTESATASAYYSTFTPNVSGS